MRLPPDFPGVVDLTAAPYHCDPTGQRDCAAALRQAFDDTLAPHRDAYAETVRLVEEHGDERHIEINRRQIVFPLRVPPARVLYLPAGVYRLSSPVHYTLTGLRNRLGNELNRCLHLMGESPETTVLRLDDRCPGFADGKPAPVLAFIHPECRGSNVAMQNSCEDLAIEVGAGNPDAVALEFYANNTGAVRNVRLRSLDPAGRGRAGLSLTRWNASCVLATGVEVEGFDCGVHVASHRLYSVFEDIRVSRQRVAGFLLEDNIVALRRLRSDGAAPALVVRGSAHLSARDCDLAGRAVLLEGEPFVTFADCPGTDRWRAAAGANPPLPPGCVSTRAAVGPAVGRGAPRPLAGIEIPDTPPRPAAIVPGQWTCVTAHGAQPDATRDCTAAVQAALDSGAPTVVFAPGQYRIDGPLEVPAHVERIDFRYANLFAPGRPNDVLAPVGIFRVVEPAERPVEFCNLFAMVEHFTNRYLVDHAGLRTVVLRDLHLQAAPVYFNSVPGGTVFIENVANTAGHNARRLPGFIFRGQRAFARQLNPERASPQVLAEDAQLWVLGFKVETNTLGFHLRGGSRAEIWGGIFNLYHYGLASEPMVLVEDSAVALSAATTGAGSTHPRACFLRAVQGEAKHELDWRDLYPRLQRPGENSVAIPLYLAG